MPVGAEVLRERTLTRAGRSCLIGPVLDHVHRAAPRAVGRAVLPPRAAPRPFVPDGGRLTAPALLELQRLAGNAGVTQLLQRMTPVQRCGPLRPDCGCAGNHEPADESQHTAAQRQADGGTPAAPPGAAQGQDPGDLTGTPYASFDPTLKEKLADKSVYDWGGAATLAAALDNKPMDMVTSLARVAAMITASAPYLWQHVQKIKWGWITDNFGMSVEWSNASALGNSLETDPGWCRDNPITSRWYHNSTDSYRQIPGSPGGASLHATITGSSTDIHIDVHQPIEGKETGFPWAGQCDLDLSAWWDHAGNVLSGGGASGTAVGRCGQASRDADAARKDPYYDKGSMGPRLDEATQLLTAITPMVRKYAAMGAMVGDEWEGDKQMQQDADTMSKLTRAEELIRGVEGDELMEKAQNEPPMMF